MWTFKCWGLRSPQNYAPDYFPSSVAIEQLRTCLIRLHLVPTFTQWTSFPPQSMSIPCVESIKSTYYLEEQVNVDYSSSRLNSTKQAPICHTAVCRQSIHIVSPSRNSNCQRPPFTKVRYVQSMIVYCSCLWASIELINVLRFHFVVNWLRNCRKDEPSFWGACWLKTSGQNMSSS